jgi:hypothetical protein
MDDRDRLAFYPFVVVRTCRSGLRQREKDEHDEEQSHPGPIQSTVAPPSARRRVRER